MLLIGTPLVVTCCGTSSIVGDLGDAIVGAVAVSNVSLSSVSRVAFLRSTMLVGCHVLRD